MYAEGRMNMLTGALTVFFSVRQLQQMLTYFWKDLILLYSQESILPSRSITVLQMNKPSVVCSLLLQNHADLVYNCRTATEVLSAVHFALSSFGASRVTMVGHSLGMSLRYDQRPISSYSKKQAPLSLCSIVFTCLSICQATFLSGPLLTECLV